MNNSSSSSSGAAGVKKKKLSTASTPGQQLRPQAAAGGDASKAAASNSRSRSPGKSSDDETKQLRQTPKNKQPSIATLMMLKKKIGDIRARQKRNRPTKRYENTYRLEPEDDKKFSVNDVRQILQNSLKFFLGESKYDARASPKLAKMVSEDVKRRMKNNFNCPRYKIIVHVTIAQRCEQNLLMASRSVMNSSTDSFVTSSFERPTFLASATAYWFYCE